MSELEGFDLVMYCEIESCVMFSFLFFFLALPADFFFLPSILETGSTTAWIYTSTLASANSEPIRGVRFALQVVLKTH